MSVKYMLEGMCKSWITPEKQMFSKFLNLQYLSTINIESTDVPREDFVGLLSTCSQSKVHSSVEQTEIDGIDIVQRMGNHTCEVSSIDALLNSHHSLSRPQVEKIFTDNDMHLLKRMYSHLYNACNIVRVSRFYLESKQVSVQGVQLLSTKSRSKQSAAIVAHWRNQTGIDPSGQDPLRVGVVTSFFCNDVLLRVESANETSLLV